MLTNSRAHLFQHVENLCESDTVHSLNYYYYYYYQLHSPTDAHNRI